MAAIADSTSLKTTAYRRHLARRLGLTGFGHWWGRELWAALPARIRAALEQRRARPVLAFDGSRATLWQPAQANGRVQMSEVAQIPLYADAQTVAAGGQAALAPLVRAAGGAQPEVVIALPARASLRKTLTLPTALEDHLHQSLAYDLDRHTPFKADELYFDAVIVDRDATHNTLRVDLAAARRAVVDTILRQAESFGARVVAVVVDPPATAAIARINLLPEDRRVATSRWTRWQVLLPAALLVVGALAALALPIWQKREQAIVLSQQSDQARQRAGVSDALRTELERKVGDYNFALERKYAFPGVLQVLDDVTRILPDDTWLTQFELHALRGKDAQRELTLRGESANAGRLVSLLEESKLFTQAAPRSPTTKIQPGPGEIFDVSAQLKPLPPPSPMPLDMVPPPPRGQPAGTSRPAAPAAGTSATGRIAGTPAPGTPAPGTPAPGTPAPGTPAPGTPAPGTPAPGTPAPGTPAPGAPVPGTAPPPAPAGGGAAKGSTAPPRATAPAPQAGGSAMAPGAVPGGTVIGAPAAAGNAPAGAQPMPAAPAPSTGPESGTGEQDEGSGG